MNINRRSFIQASSAALAAMSFPMTSLARGKDRNLQKNELCFFSKHLQYLDFREMSEILARTGFDGIDLTVRRGGHVEPATVEKDLPKAIKAAESAGLPIPMMTTGITDPEDENTHRVLKTAGELGVKYYRMGSLKYDLSVDMDKNIDNFKSLFKKFESLNREYGIHGDYQNHWGGGFGAAIWDLYSVLKGLDPAWIGCQYDIRHAVVEGGGGSWVLGMKTIAPYIATSDIKDFLWSHESGNWLPQSVPLGTGMVDFKKYFEEFKKMENACPMSLHYEYGMGQLKSREDQNLSNDEMIEFFKGDLDELKTLLIIAGMR